MKKIFLLFSAFFLWAVFSFDNKSNVVDCKEAMALLDATMKNIRSFKGKFTHIVESSNGMTLSLEKGDFLLKKGGKIKFIYFKPEGKIAVTNGKNAYLYLKDDNCAYKTKIPSKNKMPILIKMLTGETTPSKEFFCAFSQKENDVILIELGSKEKNNSIRQISVEIDEKKGFLSKISYVDEYDQRITLQFLEIEKGRDLADDIFEFTPPRGAKIFESTEDFIEELNF